jgi:hypothetical protein
VEIDFSFNKELHITFARIVSLIMPSAYFSFLLL